MRRLATVMLAATMLPAFGASPPEGKSGFSTELPASIDLSQSGLFAAEQRALVKRLASGAVIRNAPSKCYYIRQANTNLQKPKDKPEFVALADTEIVAGVSSNRSCLTDSIVRKAEAP